MSTLLTFDQYLGRKNVVDLENDRKLGEPGLLHDVAIVNGQMVRSRSAIPLECRIVKATAVVSPGHAIVYAANQYGTHAGDDAADDAQIDGIVDPFLTADLAVGDSFVLITGGPVLVVVNGNVAGPNIVGAGGGKVKSALATVANKSGRTMEDGSSKTDGQTMRVFLGKGI